MSDSFRESIIPFANAQILREVSNFAQSLEDEDAIKNNPAALKCVIDKYTQWKDGFFPVQKRKVWTR